MKTTFKDKQGSIFENLLIGGLPCRFSKRQEKGEWFDNLTMSDLVIFIAILKIFHDYPESWPSQLQNGKHLASVSISLNIFMKLYCGIHSKSYIEKSFQRLKAVRVSYKDGEKIRIVKIIEDIKIHGNPKQLTATLNGKHVSILGRNIRFNFPKLKALPPFEQALYIYCQWYDRRRHEKKLGFEDHDLKQSTIEKWMHLSTDTSVQRSQNRQRIKQAFETLKAEGLIFAYGLEKRFQDYQFSFRSINL